MSNRKIRLPIQEEITTDVIDYVLKQHREEACRINRLKSYHLVAFLVIYRCY